MGSRATIIRASRFCATEAAYFYVSAIERQNVKLHRQMLRVEQFIL